MWSYKPKSKSLNEFKNMKRLNELSITQSSIETLDGIEELVNVKSLDFHNLRTLVNISALKDLKTLVQVSFENCKSIEDFSAIQYLKKLEVLKIIACGDIVSLSFIPKLTKLRSLVFPDTNILDGNLKVCEGVYFTKQKLKTKQIDSEKRNIQNLTKPTIKWTNRMDNGDETFTHKNIDATNKVLDFYISKLMKLEDKSKKKVIMNCVKEVVTNLNELNEKYDCFIETLEREELCEYISEAVNLVGLNSDKDITEKWREW